MVVIFHKNKRSLIEMTNVEKLHMLEDMLELDEGTLNEELELSDLDEWNSMARLSLIVLMDDEFNKKLSASKIKEFKTVGDILNFME
jgi:acyl carrier protein